MSILNGAANKAEPSDVGSLSPNQTAELAKALASELNRLRLIVPVESRYERRIIIGSLVIDLDGHEAVLNDSNIDLQPREFALLRVLAHNIGRVLSRNQLIELAWTNTDRVNSTRTVDVQIRRLRVKLGEAADMICTVRGTGYKLARVKRESQRRE